MAAHSVYIDITITDDEILEADETFTVTLTTTTPRVRVGNGQTAVTITADEGILVKRILLELGMGLNFIDVTISLPTMVSVIVREMEQWRCVLQYRQPVTSLST